MQAKFYGVIVPMITPFNDDYSVDFNAIEWLVNMLVSKGVHGIFPYSTTGEFVHLKPEEGVKLVEKVLEFARGKTKIIPGISANTTLISIELGQRMCDLGVDGVIVTPPYFFKLNDAAMYEHFSMIAEKVDLPIIVYNIPAATGNPIPVHIYEKLASEYSNIAGAKITYDSTAYMRNLITTIKPLRKDFAILTGLDDHLLNTLILGGDGGIMACANFAPEIHLNLYKAFNEGKISEAIEWHKKLAQLTQIYNFATSFPSAIKTVFKLLKAPIKPISRPPLLQEPPEIEMKIREILQKVGIL